LSEHCQPVVESEALGEPLGGAEGLLEAVSFKKTTESMGRGRYLQQAYSIYFK